MYPLLWLGLVQQHLLSLHNPQVSLSFTQLELKVLRILLVTKLHYLDLKLNLSDTMDSLRFAVQDLEITYVVLTNLAGHILKLGRGHAQFGLRLAESEMKLLDALFAVDLLGSKGFSCASFGSW